MATPHLRYDFFHHFNGTWTWRRTDADGSTTSHSARHETRGEAIAEAIDCGFRPGMDYWLIGDYQAEVADRLMKTLTKREPGGRTRLWPCIRLWYGADTEQKTKT